MDLRPRIRRSSTVPVGARGRGGQRSRLWIETHGGQHRLSHRGLPAAAVPWRPHGETVGSHPTGTGFQPAEQVPDLVKELPSPEELRGQDGQAEGDYEDGRAGKNEE